MEFFLRPKNASIWAEVQALAEKGDDAAISAYVAEAQRLTTSQRNLRIATQPTTLEGKSIEPGNLVVMLLVCQPMPLNFSSFPCTYTHTITGRSRTRPFRGGRARRLQPAPQVRGHDGIQPWKASVLCKGAGTYLHQQSCQACGWFEELASRPG